MLSRYSRITAAARCAAIIIKEAIYHLSPFPTHFAIFRLMLRDAGALREYGTLPIRLDLSSTS
jgi:hypothetical protein